MRERLTFLLSLIIISLVNLSFHWPVKNPSLTSTYGESRWDHFHDGVDMVSPVRKIFPVGSGNLIFQWNRKLFPFDNFPGAGNYKVIRHTGGLYSIYMHMGDTVFPGRIVTSDLPIGVMGNSGHSFAGHLHFALIDMEKGRSINPLLKLPSVPDKKKPSIGDLFLEIKGRQVQLRNRSTIRLTRHYPLCVRISDSMKGRERLGVYRLEAKVNGVDLLNVTFGFISSTGGKMEISGKEYNGLYNDAGLYKIDGIKYRQGVNKIIIKAADFNGNMTEKEFSLNINLDM